MSECTITEPRPVVTARWEVVDWVEPDGHGFGAIREPRAGLCCTNCRCAFRKSALWRSNFCPNCGTHMLEPENVLKGKDYSRERIQELAVADRDGRCVVYEPGYPVVSQYYYDEDDGLYIRKVSGVVSQEEYEVALNGDVYEHHKG